MDYHVIEIQRILWYFKMQCVSKDFFFFLNQNPKDREISFHANHYTFKSQLSGVWKGRIVSSWGTCHKSKQTKPRGESHVHIYLPAERCCAQQLRGPREVYAKRVVCSAPDTVYYFRITIAFEDCVYDLLKTCRDEEPDVFERFF